MGVFHIQLRQFPHNVCRFNLSEPQMRAVADPWALDQWVELAERKWSPHQARLTILEGPELALEDLSMGRGWRNAERHAQDVTERVLASARERLAPAEQPAAPARPRARGVTDSTEAASDIIGERHAGASAAVVAAPQADSLALEVLALLGERGPVPVQEAWRLAKERLPDRPASETLALAEAALRSLLQQRLVVLASQVSEPTPLHAPESWAGAEEPGSVQMRRA